MPQPSAGILLFRERGERVEVLLIRPGGPFWRNKDAGAWMIPKGAIEPGETAVEAAVREFREEIGQPLKAVPFALCSIRQSGGKHGVRIVRLAFAGLREPVGKQLEGIGLGHFGRLGLEQPWGRRCLALR